MRIITAKELSSYKILPFDLFGESKSKILEMGEALTPAKLMLLKHYPTLYTDVDESQLHQGLISVSDDEQAKKMADFNYDNLDPEDFSTVVNKDNALPPETQIKIKYFSRKTLDLLNAGYFEEGLEKIYSLTNIIMTDVFKYFAKTKRGSETRFLGEYEICHSLNVAIISGLIAKRLEYPPVIVEKVVLSALLHDIGKFKMNLGLGSSISSVHEEDMVEHTIIGYNLIKNTLHLDDDIAKVALEHHENNDGSGYPRGVSSDNISEFAQIINVANYYDNLACNRTAIPVTNNKDVLRALLEVGSKRFSARMLYTFIHMYNYDDSKEFNDMMI